MACDEAIFDSFCGGWSHPTIRFYGWDHPTVSLGYLQMANGSVSPEVCASKGAALVRRPTGGRAVGHGTDFTFSVVLDARTVEGGGGIAASYRKTGEAVIKALKDLGINAGFCSNRSSVKDMRETVNCFDLCLENEVSVCGIKVLGCAQTRRGNAILQQNSLALWAPSPEVLDILGCDAKVYGSEGLLQTSIEDISHSLKKAFEETFDMQLVPGDLTYREKQSIMRLESRYRSPDWINRRPVPQASQLTP
jgi:lipoate-protein ligase A